jgi:hypothetical protein
VQRQQEAADRDELLARAELGRAAKNEMDEEAAVAGHVGRSRRYLAEMYDQGGAILANMAGNRDRIKVRACLGVSAVDCRGFQLLMLAAAGSQLEPPALSWPCCNRHPARHATPLSPMLVCS